MGRPRKFTSSKALRAAVEEYFGKISRTVDVTERVPTSERDDKGHVIYEDKPVLNDQGEAIRRREFVVPPSVAGLCLHLRIHRATWARWCDHRLHPELEEATEWAQAVLQAWAEEELLLRPGKDVRGIIFNLQNNYGYTQKVEIEAGEETRKAAKALTLDDKLGLLRKIWAGGDPTGGGET